MADPTDIEIRRAMWAAYQRQRNSAKSRNILWLFDFDSWCAFWIASGKWHERGRSKSKFVMARNGDIGPYSPANVRIISFSQNTTEARENHPEQNARVGLEVLMGRGRGWTLLSNGSYQVSLAKKYIGTFRTQEAAESAYRTAVHERRSAA